MDTKELKLQPRLACIASLVPEGARLADVGTDHGYLPVYLLQQGKIKSAIASDLRSEPLAHAKRSAKEYGVEDKIDFRLCSGLDAILPDEVDTVVIAGMGGELIVKLLEAAAWTRERALTLILQPQSKPEVLRKWLAEKGYSFTNETLVRDKGTLYAVLCLTAGKGEALSEVEAHVGVLLEKDPLYGEFLDERITKLERAITGMENAREHDEEELTRLRSLKAAFIEKREGWNDGNGC